MKRLRISLLSITALAVLVMPGMPGLLKNATAGVRVRATLHTPNVSIRVGNMPSRHYRSYVRKPLPIRRVHHQVIITRQDRKIAKRLAWYTGVPARELLFLKKRGFTWRSIGRWLDLPRTTMRAAMTQRSWKRFLRHEQRMACCNTTRCGGHQVVYADDDDFGYYDD
jgi:hypothetical protein